MIFKKRKKTKIKTIIYSAGRDGSGAIFKSLSLNEKLDTRQIYTLDLAKINAIKEQDAENVPAHILESERILLEDMPRDEPCFFITMIHDPFMRHVNQSFYQLKNRMDSNALTIALTNQRNIADYFYGMPVENSVDWFENEFLPATGINVYHHGFKPETGFQIHVVGKHKFLLLSSHLAADVKTQIISRFLGEKILPVLDETSPFDGLRDLLATQVFTDDSARVQESFWDTRHTKYFFNKNQRDAFLSDMQDTCERVLNVQDNVDQIKSASARDKLLQDAFINMLQVPHLQAEISQLTKKRGAEGSAEAVESVLRQIEKAKNNLVLASIRSLAPHNVKASITLAQNWLNRPKDARIIKSLATYMQRASAINAPLELLNTLDEMDEKTQAEKRSLESRAHLLNHPFAFSDKQKNTIAPAGKSILYLAHQSMPFHTSGYATRTQGIIKGLANDGWDMHVFSRPGYPTDTGVDAQGLTQQTIDGIPYVYDPLPEHGQHDMPMADYIEMSAAYITACAEKTRPHIIHAASNFMCGIAGVEAARRLGLPSIYEMRGLWHVTRWSKEEDFVNTDRFALAEKMEIEAAASADHVLAITGALKEWLIDRGIDGNKISLAPNAVDIGQFSYLEPDIEFAKSVGCEGKIVVGYIGSFVQYEGLDLLVEAVALLPEKLREQIRLLWIGDGPILPDLLEYAEKLNVSEFIISLGRRPFEEVPRAYSIVDISAFPRKGQIICEIVSPLKPFEAMAMHKAVIVSDVRPLKEIITHGVTGLIHQKNNSQSLSDQLALFITDRDLRISCGLNARKWIEETRQWGIIAHSISDVYKKII